MTIRRSTFLRNVALGFGASVFLAACGGGDTAPTAEGEGAKVLRPLPRYCELLPNPPFPPLSFRRRMASCKGLTLI
jgi:hypothetical protein